MSLLEDRSNAFFNAANNAESIEILAFESSDFDVTNFVNFHSSTPVTRYLYGHFVHFNGKTNSPIDSHEGGGVQNERQVKLNAAPYRIFTTALEVSYGVGEALWTSFPSMWDINDAGELERIVPEVVSV